MNRFCGRRKTGFDIGSKGEGERVESLMLESDAGFVAVSPTRALVSYYSSHEKSEAGKAITAIYLAELTLRR